MQGDRRLEVFQVFAESVRKRVNRRTRIRKV